ncbi:MAG: DUF2271 domain-containing protein [Alistipes sp.]|nr:DUF2271 domain-containing protein [Alistipes sp.]
MKKLTGLFAALVLGIGAAMAQSGQVVITMDYERQAGPGSNQWAVYIEDPAGEIVRTLYVTKFTADGGYVRRPACTPVWVEKSNVAGMDQGEIDALTGATPQSGQLVYAWDLKDDKGRAVEAGTYYFVVEGTYWGDNQVMFREAIPIGDGTVKVSATGQYNSDEEKNRGMLSGVYATYNP